MKKIISIILTIVMLSTIVMSIPFGTSAVEAADAVASIGTNYYDSLDAAIDAAQNGDVIVLLKDVTATSKHITGKNITIKGEGTTKPVITAGSSNGAFWVDGGSEVTFENIAFKGFSSKNVIIYGTQDAPDTNNYKLTINNCEFEFSASGAIYGYNCNQAEIKVTNSTFDSISNSNTHNILNLSVAPAGATYTKFINNTIVDGGKEIKEGAPGVFKNLAEITPSTLKKYDEVNPGQLLYAVDFSGDAAFIPGRTAADKGYMDYEISADGSAVTIKSNQTATDKTINTWGGLIKDLPATNETIYSMVYKAKANGTASKNNSVGIGGWAASEAGFDSTAGVYNVYTNHNTTKLDTDNTTVIADPDQRTALSNGITKINSTYIMVKDKPAIDVDDDGYVTALLVFDGTTKKFANYYLADGATALTDEASWIKFDEQDMATALDGTNANYMCFWTYAHYNVVDTTIKDVKIYKEFVWSKMATVTVNGTTTPYYDFETIFNAINRKAGAFELTLYTDATFNKAIVISDKLTIKAADGVTPTLTLAMSEPSGAQSYRGGFVFGSASNKVEFKDINIVVKEATFAPDTFGGTSVVMLNGTNENNAIGNGHTHNVIFDNVNVTSAGAVINQYGTGEFTNCNVTVNGGSVVAIGDFIEGSRSIKAEKFAFNLTVTDGAKFSVANMYSAPAGTDGFITYANTEAEAPATFGIRVTANGAIYACDTFAEALAFARANTPAEIVVMKSITAESEATTPYDTEFDVTITGANADVVLTLPTKAFHIGNSKLTFKNIKLDLANDAIVYHDVSADVIEDYEIEVVFENVTITAKDYCLDFNSSVKTATVTMTDTVINATENYMIAASTSTITLVADGLTTNKPVINTRGKVIYNLTDITGDFNSINAFTFFPTSGTIGTVESASFGNDATAKQFGYTFRVGETEGGVYYKTKAEAFAVALTTAKVYDITGTAPAEVTCDHTYSDTVVAPTCTEDGHTAHTCSICGHTYNDTTVAAAGHKYSAATCTAKAKCSVCNEETGDLAKHADANKDYKCDACGAACGTAPTTTAPTTKAPETKAPETTAPKTEEKKGCKGTVTVAGLALVAALGSCAIFVEKKRK